MDEELERRLQQSRARMREVEKRDRRINWSVGLTAVAAYLACRPWTANLRTRGRRCPPHPSLVANGRTSAPKTVTSTVLSPSQIQMNGTTGGPGSETKLNW